MRFGLIVGALLYALPALPCACVSVPSGRCDIPAANLIVVATVVSRDVIGDGRVIQAPSQNASRTRATAPERPPAIPLVNVTLRVKESFEGATGNTIVVQTDTSDCGYPFEAGHDYLVFASEFQGGMRVTTCSGTRPATMAMSTILRLRAIRDGSPIPDLFGFVGTHPLDNNPRGWEQIRSVPGVTVTARSDQREYLATTADDGTWEFRGLPPGNYDLSVKPPAHRVALADGSLKHVHFQVWRGNPCPVVNFDVFYDGSISGTISPGWPTRRRLCLSLVSGPGKFDWCSD